MHVLCLSLRKSPVSIALLLQSSLMCRHLLPRLILQPLLQPRHFEKAFLLHELFTTNGCSKAERKSRHLYNLERMMDKEFALAAIKDDELWNTIHHHRDVFTHMHDVDYTPDIRDRIVLVPPTEHYQTWTSDYANMQSSMIYGESISFEKLIERMKELENRFRHTK